MVRRGSHRGRRIGRLVLASLLSVAMVLPVYGQEPGLDRQEWDEQAEALSSEEDAYAEIETTHTVTLTEAADFVTAADASSESQGVSFAFSISDAQETDELRILAVQEEYQAGAEEQLLRDMVRYGMAASGNGQVNYSVTSDEGTPENVTVELSDQWIAELDGPTYFYLAMISDGGACSNVLASGEVTIFHDVEGIKITGPSNGSVRFMNGSKLTVSLSPDSEYLICRTNSYGAPDLKWNYASGDTGCVEVLFNDYYKEYYIYGIGIGLQDAVSATVRTNSGTEVCTSGELAVQTVCPKGLFSVDNGVEVIYYYGKSTTELWKGWYPAGRYGTGYTYYDPVDGHQLRDTVQLIDGNMLIFDENGVCKGHQNLPKAVYLRYVDEDVIGAATTRNPLDASELPQYVPAEAGIALADSVLAVGSKFLLCAQIEMSNDMAPSESRHVDWSCSDDEAAVIRPLSWDKRMTGYGSLVEVEVLKENPNITITAVHDKIADPSKQTVSYSFAAVEEPGWKQIGNERYFYIQNAGLPITTDRVTGWVSFDRLGHFVSQESNYDPSRKDVSYCYFGVGGELTLRRSVVDGVTYEFDTDGICKGIPQGFEVDNGVTKYLKPEGTYAISETVEVDGKLYLFDENESLVRNAKRASLFEMGGGTYYVAKDGSLLTGWQKIGSKMCYFATSADSKRYSGVLAGCEYDYVEAPEKSDASRKCVRIDFPSGDAYRYLTVLGKDLTGWVGKIYYDQSGLPRKGDAIDAGDVDSYRLLMVNNQAYLLNGDGEAVAGSGIVTVAGEQYLPDAKGKLLTGWQKVDGVMHYFATVDDASSGRSAAPAGCEPGVSGVGRELTYTAVDTTNWRQIIFDNGESGYFFLKSGTTPLKGWQSVLNLSGVKQKLLFDQVSGRMLTGVVKVGKSTYDLGDDGTLNVGICNNNGTYYYRTAKGTVKTGWFKDGGHRYYADSTGALAIGFTNIKGKWYYFSDLRGSIGQLQTGFFTVPNRGQSYYDPAGSNRYYGYQSTKYTPGLRGSEGEIITGWTTVVKNPSVKDSQRFTYLLSTTEHAGIAGEVMMGKKTLSDGKDYYFDARTGARRRFLLYYYGGAYTIAPDNKDLAGQRQAIESIGRFVNTSGDLSDNEDVIFVGLDPRTLPGGALNSTTAGVPLAGKYTAGNDLVMWDGGSGRYRPGQDGIIDIGDIEAYYTEVYNKTVAEYGAHNVVVVGASSGSAVTLSIQMKATEKAYATILLSPWLDASMSNTKGRKLSSGGIDYNALKTIGEMVCSQPGVAYQAATPYSVNPAPEYARDYTGLHKVVIYTGNKDVCYPDASGLATALKKVNVDVTYKCKSRGEHGYMFNGGAGATDIIRGVANIMTE